MRRNRLEISRKFALQSAAIFHSVCT